jgi:cyclopropane-fatty-acyl-phospholipid synthase
VFNEKRLARLAQRFLHSTPVPLRLRLWTGEAYDLGPSPAVTITLKAPSAVRALISPDFSKLGEAYVREQIDVDGPIAEVIQATEKFIRSAHHRAVSWTRLPLRGAHTRRQDARAIEHHYDVSNDFYRLWLDRNMTYSCAYFRSGDESLEQAQEQKFAHICRKLMLGQGERFLDIGCGWGGLIIYAARHFGVHALGVTLSPQQFEHTRARIVREQLTDRCRVELLDYRDIPDAPRFDKIASVGMFEHVGLKNLPVYFDKINRLLSANGLAINHGITTMDPQSRSVGMGAGEFIDRYIFPSGELPHLSLAIKSMSEQGLEAIDIESLRFHYAKTLSLWASRLEAAQTQAKACVGEQRYRTWLVYLAGCAHAFSRGWVSIHQILAARADRPEMAPAAWTRHYMYDA